MGEVAYLPGLMFLGGETGVSGVKSGGQGKHNDVDEDDAFTCGK